MNKICTDINQSKKLIELGIGVNTADMCHRYRWSNNSFLILPCAENARELITGDIPCWSLAALLSVLPYPHLEQNYKGKWCCRTEYADTTYLWEADNPVDACYEIVLKLHELNLL